jgi:hypothetical protein
MPGMMTRLAEKGRTGEGFAENECDRKTHSGGRTGSHSTLGLRGQALMSSDEFDVAGIPEFKRTQLARVDRHFARFLSLHLPYLDQVALAMAALIVAGKVPSRSSDQAVFDPDLVALYNMVCAEHGLPTVQDDEHLSGWNQ